MIVSLRYPKVIKEGDLPPKPPTPIKRVCANSFWAVRANCPPSFLCIKQAACRNGLGKLFAQTPLQSAPYSVDGCDSIGCDTIRSEVSKRGWRTEGVGSRKSFLCHRFKFFFLHPFSDPPLGEGGHNSGDLLGPASRLPPPANPFSKLLIRAQRLKNSIFKRDWNFQASHPPNPYLCGNSEFRDWHFQARLKFWSETEHFKRDWNLTIFGPLGYPLLCDTFSAIPAIAQQGAIPPALVPSFTQAHECDTIL